MIQIVRIWKKEFESNPSPSVSAEKTVQGGDEQLIMRQNWSLMRREPASRSPLLIRLALVIRLIMRPGIPLANQQGTGDLLTST